jgi:thymidylate synthase (FAD)
MDDVNWRRVSNTEAAEGWAPGDHISVRGEAHEVVMNNCTRMEYTRGDNSDLTERTSMGPEPDLLCQKCDVYVGFSALGVALQPEHKSQEWLRDHCWVCGRSREEVAANPRGVNPTYTIGKQTPTRNLVTGEVAEPHDPSKPYFTVNEEEARERPESPVSTAITRYVDKAMFKAEAVEEGALERPRVHLLSATPDPLGAVAAFSMMYEGRVVRDLAEITDEERRHYFDECFKTALQTPLEAIDLHFMVEGLTRATFDQMRTQRTAVFAGESLRFAVKEEIVNRPGPLVNNRRRQGIWEGAIDSIHEAYLALIADGVPAEDARGLLPMNVLTRAHWKTNLRNLVSEIGKRLCTQAQWEWRVLHADLRREIREYTSFIADPWSIRTQRVRQDPTGGSAGLYSTGGDQKLPDSATGRDCSWQFKYIAEHRELFVPICFQKGACMFKASMDRGCTIRERVDRGAFGEIADAEWLADPTAAWIK